MAALRAAISLDTLLTNAAHRLRTAHRSVRDCDRSELGRVHRFNSCYSLAKERRSAESRAVHDWPEVASV